MPGISCCMLCQKRYIGCHSNCEKYIEERKSFDELKEKQRKEKECNVFHMFNSPGYEAERNKARKKKKLQYYARGGRS